MQWCVRRQLARCQAAGVADVAVAGVLSCVHVAVDRTQLQLVRGVLAHNLGEPLDDQPHMQHAHAQVRARARVARAQVRDLGFGDNYIIFLFFFCH